MWVTNIHWNLQWRMKIESLDNKLHSTHLLLSLSCVKWKELVKRSLFILRFYSYAIFSRGIASNPSFIGGWSFVLTAWASCQIMKHLFFADKTFVGVHKTKQHWIYKQSNPVRARQKKNTQKSHPKFPLSQSSQSGGLNIKPQRQGIFSAWSF